jgi:hypothetical protein
MPDQEHFQTEVFVMKNDLYTYYLVPDCSKDGNTPAYRQKFFIHFTHNH